ncbi:hypothetical protein [Aneurinibacillus terranovensis]|uniref:hypothetical protein n=1 Tax=Aneurinibacillus terranovensis TaxID=278991 RepID=UPI00040AB778
MRVAARLIQALGASCIPGVSMIITNRYIPMNRRGEAMRKSHSPQRWRLGSGRSSEG